MAVVCLFCPVYGRKEKRVDIERRHGLLNHFLSLSLFPQDLHAIHHVPFCLASRSTMEMRLKGRKESWLDTLCHSITVPKVKNITLESHIKFSVEYSDEKWCNDW